MKLVKSKIAHLNTVDREKNLLTGATNIALYTPGLYEACVVYADGRVVSWGGTDYTPELAARYAIGQVVAKPEGEIVTPDGEKGTEDGEVDNTIIFSYFAGQCSWVTGGKLHDLAIQEMWRFFEQNFTYSKETDKFSFEKPDEYLLFHTWREVFNIFGIGIMLADRTREVKPEQIAYITNLDPNGEILVACHNCAVTLNPFLKVEVKTDDDTSGTGLIAAAEITNQLSDVAGATTKDLATPDVDRTTDENKKKVGTLSRSARKRANT